MNIPPRLQWKAMSLRDNEMVDGPTPNFATSPMNTISGVMTKMVKVLETTAGGRFSGCRKMCCTTTTKN